MGCRFSRLSVFWKCTAIMFCFQSSAQQMKMDTLLNPPSEQTELISPCSNVVFSSDSNGLLYSLLFDCIPIVHPNQTYAIPEVLFFQIHFIHFCLLQFLVVQWQQILVDTNLLLPFPCGFRFFMIRNGSRVYANPIGRFTAKVWLSSPRPGVSFITVAYFENGAWNWCTRLSRQ